MVFFVIRVNTGIGPHFAKQLVSAFGDKLIYISREGAGQLSKISGIGSKNCN